MEIERKYLVERLPKLSQKPNCRIRQGYFPLKDKAIQVRLREAGAEHTIGIKCGSGGVRTEEEIKIPVERFNRLWRLVRGASIKKNRYRIPFGQRVIQLDVYQGPHKGLLTAEVEFPDKKQSKAFRPPDWFGREITGNQRYSNEVMARRGGL